MKIRTLEQLCKAVIQDSSATIKDDYRGNLEIEGDKLGKLNFVSYTEWDSQRTKLEITINDYAWHNSELDKGEALCIAEMRRVLRDKKYDKNSAMRDQVMANFGSYIDMAQ